MPSEERDSSWLREDEKSKEERVVKTERNDAEKGEKRKREEEKEENETETVKRRCEEVFLWKSLKYQVKEETSPLPNSTSLFAPSSLPSQNC